MAIDLNALKVAAAGDPQTKVAVKRAWLAEVHTALALAAQTQAELDRLKAKHGLGDKLADIGERLFGMAAAR